MRYILLVSFLLLCSAGFLNAAGSDFLNSPAGQVLLDAGLKFLDNPADLFSDMKTLNEDLTPVIPGRHGTIRLNTTLLPFLFPFSWPGLTIKAKIISDRAGGIPQIDLFGEYGEIAALRSMKSEDSTTPPKFSDYTIGLNVTKSVTKQTRIFVGGKYSNMLISYTPKDPITFGAFSLSSLNINVTDIFVFSGLEHNTVDKPTKYIIAYAGYGLRSNKLISRISMNYKHLELGLTIIPESMLVIQPTWAYHWYF